MVKGVRSGLQIGALIALLICADWVTAATDATVTPGEGAAATRPASLSPRRIIEEAAILAGGLPVYLKKTMLREGDAVALTIEVPREGYLSVVGMRSGELPTLLFPNRDDVDNKVAAGRVSLPGKTLKFDFKASKPYGLIVFAAFLSSEALDLSETPAGDPAAEGKTPDLFAPLTAAARLRLAKLASRSFVAEQSAAPLSGGLAYGLVCAGSGPCDLATEGKTPDLFAPLTAAARLRLAKLASRSFVAEQSAAPLSGGLAYGLVCAGSGPCDLASLAAEPGSFASEGKLTPGILLEAPKEDSLPAGARLRGLPEKGLRLTKAGEGFTPVLYNDAENNCSIGYGHVVRKASCNGSEPTALRRGIREQQANTLLVDDMRRAQRAVLSLVSVALNDAQYAALCDFTYNVGAEKLEKSTLLKVINAGEHERVPAQMRRWIHVKGSEYPRLKLRREREIALYFQGQPIPKAPTDEVTTPIDIRSGE